jgi:hypothetical protein
MQQLVIGDVQRSVNLCCSDEVLSSSRSSSSSPPPPKRRKSSPPGRKAGTWNGMQVDSIIYMAFLQINRVWICCVPVILFFLHFFTSFGVGSLRLGGGSACSALYTRHHNRLCAACNASQSVRGKQCQGGKRYGDTRHICVSLCYTRWVFTPVRGCRETMGEEKQCPWGSHGNCNEMQSVGLNGVVKEWSGLLPRCSPLCQVLFIFMRAKFVCFRVFCLYFVDATEERERDGGMLCWEAHASPSWCGDALERNICPSPG